MKQKDNKIVVSARFSDGEETKISTSVNFFKEFTEDNRSELITGIEKKIKPYTDDIVYYTFRCLYKSEHDNYKFNTFDELMEKVGAVGA